MYYGTNMTGRLTTKFARPAQLYIYHTRGTTGEVGLLEFIEKIPILLW
jgi:hypothetical protein